MPSISQTIEIATSVLSHNPSQSIYMSGAPGVGKTTIAYKIAENLGIPRDRVLLFRPSLRDPVDLMGVPSVDHTTKTTSFNPPKELHAFKKGSGKGLILWDELAQSVPMMQNAIAGSLLDRELGGLEIDKDVIQIATGNRVQDKAGSNKIVSQLGNRVLHIEVETSLDDWCKWALANTIDPLLVAFMRLRPALLFDFDPNRLSNATPRSWEMVSRLPSTLGESAYQYAVSGLVGEGAAAEWVGTRKIMANMPNIQAIIDNPLTADIPQEAAIKFAVTGALAQRTSKDNAGRVLSFMLRLPREFMALYMQDVRNHNNSTIPTFVTNTPEFSQWAQDSGL